MQPYYVGGVNGCACGSYISAEHIIRHMTDLETLLTVNASQMASLKNRTFFFLSVEPGPERLFMGSMQLLNELRLVHKNGEINPVTPERAENRTVVVVLYR